MAALTIDDAIVSEILHRNLDIIVMALGDAAAWRTDLGQDDEAAIYEQLQAELEEFQEPA